MISGFKIGRITLTTTMMIGLVLAITSVGALAISTFHISNFVYYLADAFNVFLAVFAIRRVARARVRRMKEVGFLVLLLVLFIANCIIGIVGNNVSLKLAIWGSRNVYRFILFFISCVALLEKKDIAKFRAAFPKIYVINAIVAVFQYVVLGLKGDYIGGLFGTIQGCNGALTIFLNIALSYFIAGYLCGTEKLSKIVLYSILYFLVAALSETKGNYFFFVLIYAVALLVCTGYFLIVKQPEKDLHTKLGYRIKKIFNIYIIWSIVYLPLTVYGWFIEGNKTVEYVVLCIRNYILVGDNFYSWALWYLNGLIFALILIDILSKRISIEKIVGFGSVAYFVGIVLTAFGGHSSCGNHRFRL